MEIRRLGDPFRLGYEYYISRWTFDDELLKPDTMRTELLNHGLNLAEIEPEELEAAIGFTQTDPQLSLYDGIALAIAKHRGWVLLNGDKPLRRAAEREKVECHGTIWIYDQLKEKGIISQEEMTGAMDALIEAVKTGKCRLPLDELKKRRG
jgi:predicted nucleic acid-binding protein